MRGKGDSRAEAVAMFASKVQWIANATMVIMNVSLSDAGQYGCLIDLSNGESMESFIKLEVLRGCNFITLIFLICKPVKKIVNIILIKV